MALLMRSDVAGVPCRRGKVRDIYDIGDQLVLVATDRISAFDWVLPTGIPDKGRILTQLSEFWFDFLKVPHHLISTDVGMLPTAFISHSEQLRGRTMIVRKTKVIPIECVVRGYLAGSGLSEYKASGTVCGIPLPPDMREAQQLEEPIFTPATKAEAGEHDENISFKQMYERIGKSISVLLRKKSIDLYRRAARHALMHGIILADTKFEFGALPNGDILLIDEVLTPDSSRFWPRRANMTGRTPPSFDKQFVRDWLLASEWDKNSPPPELPGDIVQQTRQKYLEAYNRLTKKEFKV